MPAPVSAKTRALPSGDQLGAVLSTADDVVTRVAVPPDEETTQICTFEPSLAWNASWEPSGDQAGCESAPLGPEIDSAEPEPGLDAEIV